MGAQEEAKKLTRSGSFSNYSTYQSQILNEQKSDMNTNEANIIGTVTDESTTTETPPVLLRNISCKIPFKGARAKRRKTTEINGRNSKKFSRVSRGKSWN